MSIKAWIRKIWCIYIYIFNGLFSHKNEGNLAVCNMDGPWGLCAKLNKSDTRQEKQILYDLADMCNLKKKLKKNKLPPKKPPQAHWYREEIGGS